MSQATKNTPATNQGGGLSINNSAQLKAVLNENAEAIFAAMPKHMTRERVIAITVRCFRKNPALFNCEPVSILDSISQATAMGWELDGVLGYAYLVPYKKECVLIPGYKGLIKAARNSGEISTIDMQVVHQGDHFRYGLGDKPFIEHRINEDDAQREEKPITHAYVVVTLKDGGVQRNVWTASKINNHKEMYSKAWDWAENGDPKRGGGKKDSFWHTNWDVGAKKTVLRDMVNRGLLPVSAEVQRLSMREELIENRIIDGSARTTVSSLNDIANRLEQTPAGETIDHETPQQESPLAAWEAATRIELAKCRTPTAVAAAKEKMSRGITDPDDPCNDVLERLCVEREQELAAAKDAKGGQGTLLDKGSERAE